MSTVTRDATVYASSERIWARLIEDPNCWTEWLTPVRSLEEKVTTPTRQGLEFGVRLGKLAGKVRVTEVATARRLSWKTGPSMMMAMGIGMKGSLHIEPTQDDHATKVHLEMKSPMGPMGPMMMRMMAGLDTKKEMTASIDKLKALAER